MAACDMGFHAVANDLRVVAMRASANVSTALALEELSMVASARPACSCRGRNTVTCEGRDQ
jgi:hypothetical protein